MCPIFHSHRLRNHSARMPRRTRHLPQGGSGCLESGTASSWEQHPRTCRGWQGLQLCRLSPKAISPRERERTDPWITYISHQAANYCRATCASTPPSSSPFWGAGSKDTTAQVTMKGRQPRGSSQKASFSPFLPQSPLF